MTLSLVTDILLLVTTIISNQLSIISFSQKHKPPCSLDSELYQKLVVQLKRSPIVSPLRLVCSSHGGTSGGHHSNNEDELHLSVEYGAENSTPGTGLCYYICYLK